MKKTLSLLFGIMATTAAFAQPDVVSAYNLNSEGRYEEAAVYIDKALLSEKAVVKEKTWRYRGDIYTNIALDPVLREKTPDALDKALESYLKARELDTKKSYAVEITTGLGRVLSQSMNVAIENYNSQKYAEAANYFLLGDKTTSAAFDSAYTQAIYNAALSFEKAGDIDNAVKYYNRCGELEYQVPEVYLFVANLLNNNERTDEALEVLKGAREKYPRDKNLIIEELNIYLRRGNFEAAEANLKLACEQDPTNEVLYFSMGSVYDNLGKSDEAVSAYKKALELKSDYFDANYNLGALYFNQGVAKVNEANDVPPSQNKRYKILLEEATGIFNTALPYLESAHTANPEDKDTMRSLRDIYARIGKDDKMLEMKNKLEK
ncbi:MAG: tetratricopeptide repeat protein [Cryomorphaceae bacterium]|nr:tetratricopeptide repeat protein [Cryomorphaceae bacterium]